MAAPEHKWHKWPARLCLDSSIVRASHNFFLLLIELLELHIISILRINKTFPAISGVLRKIEKPDKLKKNEGRSRNL